ncbi:hypothetical protein VTL71DRAFT_2857 [Oculimacula yallundae]|uniref:Uncharacterized protein n=1 Tax=Oculimacula yallundae TaxID=86028 RepID=A0ABR4C5H8_9HELO
MAENLDIFS